MPVIILYDVLKRQTKQGLTILFIASINSSPVCVTKTIELGYVAWPVVRLNVLNVFFSSYLGIKFSIVCSSSTPQTHFYCLSILLVLFDALVSKL